MIVDHATHRRKTIGIGLFVAGVILTVIACGFLGRSVSLLSRKRDTALTVGTTLPELTSSATLLRATVAAEKLFTEQSLLSQEELASAYVLPNHSPVPRFVGAVQTIVAAVGHGLSVESTRFDSPAPPDHGVRTYVGHVMLRGTYQDSARLLGILGLSGKSLVRDALTPEAHRAFLALVEESAPLALKDAVRFLYTDLMAYAASPDQLEEQALRDLPASVVPDARALLLQGGLAQVRSSLTDIAASIRGHDTWPLPLTTVTRLERAGDRWTVEVQLIGRFTNN